MKETITLELSTKLFYGFYESIHNNSDLLYEEDMDLKEELEEVLPNIESLEVEHDYYNFNEYKKDVSIIFIDKYMEYLLDVIPEYIQDNEYFLLKLRDPLSYEVWSPKYYNYLTDSIYWIVETNYYTLDLIKKYVLSMEGASKYIKDHFSSYDGFISFLPNNIDVWIDLDITKYESNNIWIYCLFDMLLILDNQDNIFNINYDTWEEVEYYNYLVPTINYNGVEYTYSQIMELINKNK